MPTIVEQLSTTYASASAAPFFRADLTASSAVFNSFSCLSATTDKHLLHSCMRTAVTRKSCLAFAAPSRPQLKIFTNRIHLKQSLKRVPTDRSISHRLPNLTVDDLVSFLNPNLTGTVQIRLTSPETLQIISKLDALKQFFQRVVSRLNERVSHAIDSFNMKGFSPRIDRLLTP